MSANLSSSRRQVRTFLLCNLYPLLALGAFRGADRLRVAPAAETGTVGSYVGDMLLRVRNGCQVKRVPEFGHQRSIATSAEQAPFTRIRTLVAPLVWQLSIGPPVIDSLFLDSAPCAGTALTA